MTALVRHNPSDSAVARHEAAHAAVAYLHGWGVGRISAVRNGDTEGFCAITPPASRSDFQLALEEATILIAGRVGCLVGDDRRDTERAVELARSIAWSDEEGQAILDFCHARAFAMVQQLDERGVIDNFVERMDAAGGEIDLDHPARRDFKPLIEVPVTINMPPPERSPRTLKVIRDENGDASAYEEVPTINITNEIIVPPAQNKIIRFDRDSSGAIVEASSEDADPTPAAA